MEKKTAHLTEKAKPPVELPAKEKVLEVIALGFCFMLLFASFLKVVFF